MIMRQNNKKSREIFAGFFVLISVCSPISGEQQINSEHLIIEKGKPCRTLRTDL